jgi:hypothetical protein
MIFMSILRCYFEDLTEESRRKHFVLLASEGKCTTMSAMQNLLTCFAWLCVKGLGKEQLWSPGKIPGHLMCSVC